MELEAVIFDMDGLMLDTERLGCESWLAAAQELGIAVEPAQYHRLVGLNRRDSQVILQEMLGTVCDIDAYQERAWQIYRVRVEQALPCKPGLFELLDHLDLLGVRKGVATSTGAEMARHKLESSNILHRFDAMATGNEVEFGKPHPEIYLLCAKRLGADIRNCVILEDSPNGVRGAHASGAKVVMIPDLIQPTDELRTKTDAIFLSLADVPAFLERLNAKG